VDGSPVAEEPNYTLGHGHRLVSAFGQRTSDREAHFVLPYLEPGMDLLDCGCGPGAITVGLAQYVAPGHVVGIDICSDQFHVGESLAAERGVANVSFQRADLTKLPFDDASFDGVFAHGVLYHLSDVQAALQEMRRVLRDSGLIAVRDADEGGSLMAPQTPVLARAQEAVLEAWIRNGTDPFFGRQHRPLLRDAGFEPLSFAASYDNYATPAETRGLGKFTAQLLRQPHMAEPLITSGWTTEHELDEMAAAFERWGGEPDAFYARARCETVARRI
jgi:ubiquinone/menaquinone biosynthesis C-methylase UbiE